MRRTSVNIQAVLLPGDTREKESIFQVRHGKKPEKFIIIVDGGDRTHDPKTHGLSTTPFVKVLAGH